MYNILRKQLTLGALRKDRPRKRRQSFNPRALETDDSSFTSTSAKKLKGDDKELVPEQDTVLYSFSDFVLVYLKMTEKSAISAPVEEKAPAKVDSPKKATKEPAAKAPHPSVAVMVTNAIQILGDRKGSSAQAIKKCVALFYSVDIDKQAPFITKFLKSAVTKGILIQTKGKGESGLFQLAATEPASKLKVAGKKKAPKQPAAKKPATKKASGEAKVAKTRASPKKAPVKKPISPKKPAAKSPAKPKAKKATKAPTAKPKSPKPKKTATKVAKSPAKKAAAKN